MIGEETNNDFDIFETMVAKIIQEGTVIINKQNLPILENAYLRYAASHSSGFILGYYRCLLN